MTSNDAIDRDQSIPDASMAAQVQAIEKSFWEMENSPLEELKHPDPSKAHLKAVDVSVMVDTQ
jgi:hypothetical protein